METIDVRKEDAMTLDRLRRVSAADLERIAREIGQTPTLPREVRGAAEDLWSGQPVQLFAMIDVDAAMKLTESWLMLGPSHVALASRVGGEWKIRSFPLEEVKSVKETPGLSLTRLVIGSEDPEAPLIVVRYTHRQKRAVGHISFCLEQELKERESQPSLASTSQAGTSLMDTGSSTDRLQNDRFRDRTDESLYAEAMLAPLKEAQALDTSGKLAVVWRLLGYLKPYKKQVALGLGGAVLMTLSNLVPPFLTGRLIDQVIRPFEVGKLSGPEALKIAWITVIGLAVVFVMREAFAWLRLRLMSMIGEYVASDLRSGVYTHLHKLSLSYFSSKQTGSLISRVSSDTDRIWDFVAFGVVEVATSVMMLMGLSIVLLTIDWRLGLIVTIPLPLILGAIYLHGQRMQGLFLRAWRKWSALTDCLSDTIPGVRVVKAFNREAFETVKFNERNDDLLGEFERIHVAWTTFWPGLMLTIQLVILGVWSFGLPRVLGESGAPLSAGEFISFILYLTMFMQPIEVIGQMSRMVNRATSSAYRVFEVLDTEPQLVDQGKQIRLEPLQGHIRFENVFFSYDGVRPVLRNVSFEVQPGEMIGLVGPSGSGKTTVINLLARFYDTSAGRVLVDDVELRDLDSGHYRCQIGMVLQDPYLFHGSILENIRYAKPEATLNEVIKAAQAANAHKFISKLPHGYDTIVGERGQSLSGGERQRVSIARAILLNPRILILDEATSAVDTETERQIQEALDRLVKGRTVIAIAHRLSTLTRADRLLVMKDGRLVEQGRHADLLALEKGVFAGLYKLQQELHASSVV